MKVVRKPDYSNWTFKFTCMECTAELEACSTDVEGKFHPAVYDPREGTQAAYWSYSVTCPICTTARQINASDVPKGLQFEIKDRTLKT